MDFFDWLAVLFSFATALYLMFSMLFSYATALYLMLDEPGLVPPRGDDEGRL